MAKQRSLESAAPCQVTELLTVTAGVIYVGSGVRFTRPNGKGGHITARGINAERGWIYGHDCRGAARVARFNEIYWVGDPPAPQKQRDITPRRRRGRR